MSVSVAIETGDAALAAGARSQIYACLAWLSASPATRADDQPLISAALQNHLDRLGIAADALPFALECDGLIELADSHFSAGGGDALCADFARAYGAAFEVGDRGPPLAIREELVPGISAGNKEEVARFYEHFGYELADGYAWQPDHLTVLFEFMHFLSYSECAAETADAQRDLRAAQRDFLGRHILNWLPATAAALAEKNASAATGSQLADDFLPMVFAVATSFAHRDHDYLTLQRSRDE